MSLHKPKQDVWANLKKYNDWVAEPKLDGERCTIVSEDGKLTVLRDNGRVKNHIYPELLEIEIPDGVTLDGEVCIPKNEYYADFNTFQQRMNLQDKVKINNYLKSADTTVSFVAFDILKHDYNEVMSKSWKDRRSLLESIPTSKRLKRITTYQPQELFPMVQQYGMEGIVLKSKSSVYEKDWVKMKNLVEKDFRVVGYNTSDKRFISTIIIEDMENGDPMGNVTYFGPKFPQTQEAADKLKGSTAVIQFLESGAKDKPRFPVLKEIRHN
jgi:DNA ligase-1